MAFVSQEEDRETEDNGEEDEENEVHVKLGFSPVLIHSRHKR